MRRLESQEAVIWARRGRGLRALDQMLNVFFKDGGIRGADMLDVFHMNYPVVMETAKTGELPWKLIIINYEKKWTFGAPFP